MIEDLVTSLLDAAAQQVFQRAFTGEPICADQLVAAADYQRWRLCGVVVCEQLPAGAALMRGRRIAS